MTLDRPAVYNDPMGGSTRTLVVGVAVGFWLAMAAACRIPSVVHHDFQDGGVPDTNTPSPATATLTVVVDDEASGVVTSQDVALTCDDVCPVTVEVGTVVRLTATPNSDTRFTDWVGGGCETEPTCAVTVTGDMVVTAQFEVVVGNDTFELRVDKAGDGSGFVESISEGVEIDCGETCVVELEPGTMVTLRAESDAESLFVGWDDERCAGAGRGACTIEMTSAATVVAIFEPASRLTIELDGNGTVTSDPDGIDCPEGCSRLFVTGSVVELTAHWDESSGFIGWSDDACGSNRTCVVELGDDVEIIAFFERPQFELTVVTTGDGIPDVRSEPSGIQCDREIDDCAQIFNAGTTVTLTAFSSGSSSFAGWSGGGCETSETDECTVEMNSDVTVTANFEAQGSILTVDKAGLGGGTITSSRPGIVCGPTCSASFPPDIVVTLTASPFAESAVFIGWQGACTGSDPNDCHVDMSEAQFVTAVFAPRRPLYAINEIDDRLELINMDDNDGSVNRAAVIGSLGFDVLLGDLAWSSADSTLYMVAGFNHPGLYKVGLSSGAADLVGQEHTHVLTAIAYHPGDQQLYGLGGSQPGGGPPTALFQINRTTGALRQIGITSPQIRDPEGLAWDPLRSRMVSINNAGVVHQINLETAGTAQLASGLDDGNAGMTFDLVRNVFLVGKSEDNIFRVDPNDFSEAPAARFGRGHTGVAFVPATSIPLPRPPGPTPTIQSFSPGLRRNPILRNQLPQLPRLEMQVPKRIVGPRSHRVRHGTAADN